MAIALAGIAAFVPLSRHAATAMTLNANLLALVYGSGACSDVPFAAATWPRPAGPLRPRPRAAGDHVDHAARGSPRPSRSARTRASPPAATSATWQPRPDPHGVQIDPRTDAMTPTISVPASLLNVLLGIGQPVGDRSGPARNGSTSSTDSDMAGRRGCSSGVAAADGALRRPRPFRAVGVVDAAGAAAATTSATRQQFATAASSGCRCSIHSTQPCHTSTRTRHVAATVRSAARPTAVAGPAATWIRCPGRTCSGRSRASGRPVPLGAPHRASPRSGACRRMGAGHHPGAQRPGRRGLLCGSSTRSTRHGHLQRHGPGPVLRPDQRRLVALDHIASRTAAVVPDLALAFPSATITSRSYTTTAAAACGCPAARFVRP